MKIIKSTVTAKDIRNIIRYKRLTIQQFADSVYVSRRTVHNWLNGKAIEGRRQKQINDIYGIGKLPNNTGEENLD